VCVLISKQSMKTFELCFYGWIFLTWLKDIRNACDFHFEMKRACVCVCV
jgi:hypothetical protein